MANILTDVADKVWNSISGKDIQDSIASRVMGTNVPKVSGNLTKKDIQDLLDEGYTSQDIIEGYQKATAAKKATPLQQVEKVVNPKKKTTTAPESTDTIEQQLAASNDWNTLGQSIVSADQALTGPASNVGQAISGQLTQPATSEAEQTALAAIGLSPKSSAASWLSSQIKQGEANDAPLQKAMAQYGQEYQQGQAGVQTALGQMGTANQEEVATAPNEDWVQSLAQHVMSNINYYGEVPSSLINQIPDYIKYFLGQSGVGGTSAGGTTPVNQLSQGLNQSLEFATAPTTNKLPPIASSAAGATPGVIPTDTGAAPS